MRQTHSEHLQMFRTHVSRNLCLEILEHARFIPQLTSQNADMPHLTFAESSTPLTSQLIHCKELHRMTDWSTLKISHYILFSCKMVKRVDWFKHE